MATQGVRYQPAGNSAPGTVAQRDHRTPARIILAPLVCMALGALLDPFLPPRLGRVIVWGLVGLVLLAGLTLWSEAIFLGVKPSANPLTH